MDAVDGAVTGTATSSKRCPRAKTQMVGKGTGTCSRSNASEHALAASATQGLHVVHTRWTAQGRALHRNAPAGGVDENTPLRLTTTTVTCHQNASHHGVDDTTRTKSGKNKARMRCTSSGKGMTRQLPAQLTGSQKRVSNNIREKNEKIHDGHTHATASRPMPSAANPHASLMQRREC